MKVLSLRIFVVFIKIVLYIYYLVSFQNIPWRTKSSCINRKSASLHYWLSHLTFCGCGCILFLNLQVFRTNLSLLTFSSVLCRLGALMVRWYTMYHITRSKRLNFVDKWSKEVIPIVMSHTGTVSLNRLNISNLIFEYNSNMYLNSWYKITGILNSKRHFIDFTAFKWGHCPRLSLRGGVSHRKLARILTELPHLAAGLLRVLVPRLGSFWSIAFGSSGNSDQISTNEDAIENWRWPAIELANTGLAPNLLTYRP